MKYMDVEGIIIGAAISINALILVVTSLLSYKKYGNVKLLFIFTAFMFFLIRGILFSLGLFYEFFEVFTTTYYLLIFDILILNVLYFSALKR